MDDRLNITVVIEDRKYPMTIEASEKEEEKIRRAVKEVNNLINSYKQKYVHHDAQDALAMTILTIMRRLLTCEENQSKELIEHISTLYSEVKTFNTEQVR